MRWRWKTNTAALSRQKQRDGSPFIAVSRVALTLLVTPIMRHGGADTAQPLTERGEFMGKRYTLSLTYDQLSALKNCFDGNFSGGYEEEGSETEKKIGRRLDRMSLKAYADSRKAK